MQDVLLQVKVLILQKKLFLIWALNHVRKKISGAEV